MIRIELNQVHLNENVDFIENKPLARIIVYSEKEERESAYAKGGAEQRSK